MIIRCVAALAFVLAFFTTLPAAAQEGELWVQIEALPDEATALERARAYSALFPETNGFRLRSGWFGIVLGPYPADEAPIRLDSLKRDGLIAEDSFIAYSRDFGDRFWPQDGAAPVAPETPDPEVIATPEPEPDPLSLPDETRQEARDSEALLTEQERMDLQVALQWFGFYQGGIDGAYGPGTRNSMAAWQEAQGMLEPTGILTSRQRAELLSDWRAETAAFGFQDVTVEEAGITLTLPTGLVEFDHFEPPFVHYRAKDGTGPRIILISQPGDEAAFQGLYDILQTLESVPLTGEREKGDKTFRIRGTSDKIDTTIEAELKGGLIKGWMLISSPGNDARDARLLQSLKSGFKPLPDRALDPGMVAMGAETKAGLLSGLEVRKPKFSRSGFFIDASGAVLTTVEAVDACGRITLDRATDATVTLSDKASGLALLTPATPLAPRAVAEFQAAPERLGSEIMVAGYSYEDRLPAPVMTFGTLDEATGLNGEAGLRRLGIQALPGDAGGPVLDGSGAVIGMLLPAGPEGGKQLPPGVFFAASANEIARVLATSGITPLQSAKTGALAPVDLTAAGTGMTVLVSCWD